VYDEVDLGSCFAIVRYKPLQRLFESDPSALAQFELEIHNATCKAYNHGIALRRAEEERLFCSHLVARVFQGMELNPFGVPPHKVLPTTIVEAIAQSPADWLDLTDSFVSYCTDSEDVDRLCHDLRHQADVRTALEHAKDFIRQQHHAWFGFRGEAGSLTGLASPNPLDWRKKMSERQYQLFRNMVGWIDREGGIDRSLDRN
jgi:hypothetical protein